MPAKLNVARGAAAVIHYLKSSSDNKTFVGKELICARDQATLHMLTMREWEALKIIYQSAQRVPENIVCVYGVADVELGSGKRTLLIMEKLDGPSGLSLLHTIGRLPVIDAEKLNLIKFTIRSLLLAARDASNAGVVHCDITPINFMYTNGGTLKVIDFGGWTRTQQPPMSGTDGYEAPESRPRVEKGTVMHPVPVYVNAYVRVPEVPPVSGGNVENNKYQYAKKIVGAGIQEYKVERRVPPAMDEKSDVYSIGVIFSQFLKAIDSNSESGWRLCNYMTKEDRISRLNIGLCLINPFLANVQEDVARRTLKCVQR